MRTRTSRVKCNERQADRPTGWDANDSKPPSGGIVVAISPDPRRVRRARRQSATFLTKEPGVRPPQWTPKWREALEDGISSLLASRELPGAQFPAINVPRFVHGQSQGICDLFGARVELQPDGYYFVHPLPPDPDRIDAMAPQALATSMYWGAVEWIAYARAASQAAFPFRNPVMTGPFDTANYLLGTTVLMEWVYTQADALHRLLDKITTVLIAMLGALQQATGGVLHGDALGCMRNAFCLCSECRSLVSAAVYEEFEAPYLARIGRARGPYAIHSCGSWERTVPSALQDLNLHAMNGQVRENDLATLCRLARGRIVLSIGPSRDLDLRYTWPDRKSFLEYIVANVPAEQAVEIRIDEAEQVLWKKVLAYAGR